MAITEKYVTGAGAGAADGSSLANALSWAGMITQINAGGTAGNRYNVDASATISRTTTTDTISGSGTITSPVIIRFYNSSNGAIGSGYQGRTNGNGDLITTNMGSLTYTTGRLAISGTFIILESANITSAANGASLTVGSDDKVKSCRIANTSTNANGSAINTSSTRPMFFDCDILQTGASGGAAAASLSGASSRIDSSRITSTSGNGINLSSTATASGNVVYNCGNHGIAITATNASCRISRNTIVGCAGDGVNIVTGTTGTQEINGNMITDCTGYGLNMVSTSNGAFDTYNRFRNNTAGNTNNAGDWITASAYGDVIGSGAASTDYVDAGSNDYSLIASSPATSAGSPAYASIGALQRSQTSSGIAKLINGGFVSGMKYLGDVNAGTTVRFSFNTNDASGNPITLAGTPTVAIYKSGSTTESTDGVTLTVDYDSRTGLHHVTVDQSANGTFYAAGSEFRAVLTAGTVSGISQANIELAQWSIENRNQYADLRKALGNAITTTTSGVPDVNASRIGGTAQTGRDIGASVLLSSGTGTGQLDFTSGVVKASLVQILGTALSGTAAYIAAGFSYFWNVATPSETMNDVGGSGGGTIQNNITIPSAVAQGSVTPQQITCVRGDTLSVALPVMGNISTRDKLWLTVKRQEDLASGVNTDSLAILQVIEGTGLTSLNGVQSGLTASDASLTVTNATTGAVTLVVKAAATAQLSLQDLAWDAQWLSNAGVLASPISGTFSVTADVTQATS